MNKGSKTNNKTIFVKHALLGIVGLTLFYYILLYAVTKDPKHPFIQFMDFQPWMSFLIVGFGIQVGLYGLLKNGFRINMTKRQRQESKIATGGAGAVSGVSMVACCAHHVADVLPIIGVSGAALFLTEYQNELLMVGIVSNIIGIIYMIWVIVGKQKPRVLVNYLLNPKSINT